MKQKLEQYLQKAFNALQKAGDLPPDLNVLIAVDRTNDAKHGDYASNVALLLAKPALMSPRLIAQKLIAALPQDECIAKVEIAGAGFINFFIAEVARNKIVAEILAKKDSFGHSQLGQGVSVLLEFVSSNPTGPLHVGHGRSAAFGASLANILRASGFSVATEYYLNDAGRQMDILAVSLWLRYLALQGEAIVFPVAGYRGDYVIEIAKTIANADYVHPWDTLAPDLGEDETAGGDKERYIDALIAKAKTLLGVNGFDYFHKLALTSVLADIKADLADFGVVFDKYFSEQSLVDDKSLEKGILALKEGGHTYEHEGALWFRGTSFGDDKDRVLVRANGNATYFASDVAYHWNKYSRKFDKVIDLFGADHHGYVPRVKAAVEALGHNADALVVLFVQFAILYRGSERVQMSTRSGSFVTLRELREEVGNDAARYFYIARKPEQHMDFDLELAKSQSNDNPVYYIQYAHARICSVMRQLAPRGLDLSAEDGLKNLAKLDTVVEQTVINLLGRYEEVVAAAANEYAPHLIAYYLRDLASALHSYYNAVQLLCEDEVLRAARLCLLQAVSQVLKNGLSLIGVHAPERM